MTTEPRYEIRTGKFGQYFHDAGDGYDMALADVLALLNANDLRSTEARDEADLLRASNRRLTDKLARIVSEFPTGDIGDRLRAIALESLPAHDPLAAELSRENMLREIDELLQRAGLWSGGRVDSIAELITRYRGMSTCLRLVDQWIERDGPAIRSWVEGRRSE